MRFLFLFFLSGCCLKISAQQFIWHMVKDGGIQWDVQAGRPHTDHIEMSGKKISMIVTYGTDNNDRMILRRKLVFPMLRTIPNDTRGSLTESYDNNIVDSIKVNNKYLNEIPASFYIKGYLKVRSEAANGIELSRTIYPSVDKAACFERYLVCNKGTHSVQLQIPMINSTRATVDSLGVYGIYLINYHVYNGGVFSLAPGESRMFYTVFSARKKVEPSRYFSADFELEKRKELVQKLEKNLLLTTPNDTINRMFGFAKIRAAESIFDTHGGLMHSPGGGDYYAAIWANDEAEYIDPFFPFLGYAEGNESAKNSYRLFAGYMNPSFNPIPSSIIAEGQGIWNGAGDRGDAAMIAYGASRFALLYADTLEARRLWSLIDWCLSYLQHKKNADGVISSTSDELEGRFPSGKINLSTNTLAYGAMVYASRLAKTLGKDSLSAVLQNSYIKLRQSIEQYFGAKVQGFNTYRYYDGNTVLRSWICLPLVMGIFDRKQQTIAALLSPYLWTKNGILTASGSKTFWDRATLYAFRGLFYAGATDLCYPYLSYYSAMRLLGNHVPYAIEAWPEGGQRQLSAESGLYCRAVIEGLFGIDPVGFHSFMLSPKLPAMWNRMSLHHIKAFGRDFDIDVERAGAKEKIIILEAGKKLQEHLWDSKLPLQIKL